MKKKKLRLKKRMIKYSKLLLMVIILFFLVRSFLNVINIKVPNVSFLSIFEKKEEVKKVSLVMVGDVLLHDAVYKDAKNNKGYDFSKMLKNIKPIVSNYDLAFYNQETIIGGAELGFSTYPRFNSPKEIGDNMVDLGFNLVSLANNHTLDRGEKAIIHSREFWNQKDVIATGSYRSFEEENMNYIKEKNSIKYTLLSYTDNTNGIKVPKGKEYLVSVFDLEKVKADIERVRDKVDLLMVSIHFGDEYTFKPNDRQKEIATYLASLGVDIVIGTHPHVVQPIEYIDRTLVIYSLGNFISAQRGTEKLVGLMASLDVVKEKDKIKIDNIGARLIYTNSKISNKTRYGFELYAFDQLNNSILKDYRKIYEKYINIVTNNQEFITKLGNFTVID